MELWIRTQDKKDLIKVDYISYEIAIEDKHILWYKSIDLGTYKTEERALEVLDEIQELLDPKPRWICTQHTEFDSKEKGLIGFATYKEEPKIEKLSDTIVYEMPKE